MRILLVISFLLLSGCWWNKPAVRMETKEVPRAKLNLPDPDPVVMKDFQWIVVTPENFEEKIAELQRENINIAIFGLTDEGYEKLSVNFARLRAYIESQKAVILAYREYYENENEEKK